MLGSRRKVKHVVVESSESGHPVSPSSYQQKKRFQHKFLEGTEAIVIEPEVVCIGVDLYYLYKMYEDIFYTEHLDKLNNFLKSCGIEKQGVIYSRKWFFEIMSHLKIMDDIKFFDTNYKTVYVGSLKGERVLIVSKKRYSCYKTAVGINYIHYTTYDYSIRPYYTNIYEVVLKDNHAIGFCIEEKNLKSTE